MNFCGESFESLGTNLQHDLCCLATHDTVHIKLRSVMSNTQGLQCGLNQRELQGQTEELWFFFCDLESHQNFSLAWGVFTAGIEIGNWTNESRLFCFGCWIDSNHAVHMHKFLLRPLCSACVQCQGMQWGKRRTFGRGDHSFALAMTKEPPLRFHVFLWSKFCVQWLLDLQHVKQQTDSMDDWKCKMLADDSGRETTSVKAKSVKANEKGRGSEKRKGSQPSN